MKPILLFFALFIVKTSFANDPTDSLQQLQEELRKIDSINSKLHYKSGKVSLAGNTIQLNVPANFRFLDSADARYVLEEVWGNPKGQTALGMLVPANMMAPIADYAFVVEYQGIGYVKDHDAADINYSDLLKEMQEDAVESNKAREAQGFPAMNLLGWAAQPFYDKERNVLHWAKEFSVTGNEGHTLNYDVRVLGRKGVLVLQAVSGIDQIDSVQQNINPLLGAVSFAKGHRYTDFDESTDEIAAWTIGGLVAGKVLAKVGFFAVIMKFFKIIAIGVVSLIGGAVKYFRRKKTAETPEEALAPAEEIQA